MTEIVCDPEHSDGAPTIDDTGIRVVNVASADEHSGYSPDEIVEFPFSRSKTCIRRSRTTTRTSRSSVMSNRMRPRHED